MRLRTKMFLIVGGVLLALTGFLFLSAWIILQESYHQLEMASTRQQVLRVRNTLVDEMISIDDVLEDWAHWDDTFDYITGDYDEYPDDNFGEGMNTLPALDYNFAALIDTEGEIHFTQAVDLQTRGEIEFPPGLAAKIYPGSPILDHPEPTSSLLGVLQDEALLLFAARPILTSTMERLGEGGTFIFGYFLDDARLEQLGTRLELSLTAFPADAPDLPTDFVAAAAELSDETEIYVQALDDQTVAGYAMFNDIDGNPAFFLRIDVPRDVFRLGQETLGVFLGQLVVLALAAAVLAFILVDRLLLKRIRGLSQRIDMVREHEQLNVSIPVQGNDELTNLARGFRDMLTRLATSRDKLQQAHDELEKRVAARTAELVEANHRLSEEIAERTQAEIRAEQAHEEAVKALQIQNQIVSNMSHDARTPLSIISLHSEMIRRRYYGDVTEKQLNSLNIIETNVMELSGSIENLLEKSRSNARHVDLKITELEIEPFVSEVIASIKPLAEKKNLETRISVAPDVPAVISSDRNSLTHLLNNLLSNAIKFTDTGSITVHIERPDDDHWSLQVADTGMGIAPADQKRIFDPFWQVDSSLTRRVDRGVGLGLVIVKELVERLQGDIRVESEIGKGSQFTAILPFELTNPTKQENNNDPEIRHHR